jgi:hypothetical protein
MEYLLEAGLLVFLLFLLGVALSRWIFRINDIADSLKSIREILVIVHEKGLAGKMKVPVERYFGMKVEQQEEPVEYYLPKKGEK